MAKKKIENHEVDRGEYVEQSTSIVVQNQRYVIPPFSYSEAVRQFHGIVYALTSLNANAVAAQTLRLYAKRTVNKRKLYETRSVDKFTKRWLQTEAPLSARRKAMAWRDDFEEVTEDHPVIKLITDPSPDYQGFNLLASIMIYLQLTGNAYLLPLIGDDDVPSTLEIMPSQYVWVKPGNPESNRLIDGYWYDATGVKYRSKDDDPTYEASQVLHFRMFNPESLYYGKGYVESAWRLIQTVQAAEEHDFNLYKNGCRPDYLLIVRNGMSPEDYRRLKSQYDNNRGPKNSGKPLVVTNEADVKNLTFSPKDMGPQLEQLEKLCAVWKQSISMLKMNDSNYNTGQTGNSFWLKNGVLPFLSIITDVFNTKLLPMFDLDDCFLAFDSPIPEETRYYDERNRLDVAAGIMTPNEARNERGIPPHPDGDNLGPDLQQSLPENAAQTTPTNEPILPPKSNDLEGIVTKALENMQQMQQQMMSVVTKAMDLVMAEKNVITKSACGCETITKSEPQVNSDEQAIEDVITEALTEFRNDITAGLETL